MKKVFKLEGLDCPHCSSEIEKRVGEIGSISASSVNLIQQTLTVDVDDKSAGSIMRQIEDIVHVYEPDVSVYEYKREKNNLKKRTEIKDGNNKKITRIVLGAVLFGLCIILPRVLKASLYVRLAVMIVAYTVLGYDVVIKAVKNIFKGRVFDENFLMSLSSIGAFCIGEYFEAIAVMLLYQVGEFFQDAAVERSRRSIVELMDIRPDYATVIRDGEKAVVSPDTVSVGELIVIKPGEKIPLDGIVVEGKSMVDTKALTGESVPKSISENDEVLSGFINQSGVLTVRVTKTLGESAVSKIIDLVENASARKAPAENFITKFAGYYTPAVTLFAVILAIIPPLLFNGEWTAWIHRSFVFLVISCPCALVISIPLTFFAGIGAASKHGVLVKGGNYLEALSSVNTVVFDKTGTLTRGTFKVTKILAAENFKKEEILEYAAKAEYYSSHPIAKSVILAYGKKVDRKFIKEYKEISGMGISAEINERHILVGNAKLMETEEIEYIPCNETGTKVYIAVDKRYAGYILIDDELKTDSKKTIDELKRIGVRKTVMLTGDDESIGRAVSSELGIDECYARLLPDQKVEKIELYCDGKWSQGKLAFVGDGINDAPVLARADVGIAMGGLGSDAAVEAADVVLMTDETYKLVEAIKIAKITKRTVVQNIVFTLFIKCVFLWLGAFGLVGMWAAVFGDVGVALIAILNAMRILRK